MPWTKVDKSETATPREISWATLGNMTWAELANTTWADLVTGYSKLWTNITKTASTWSKVVK